MVYGEVGAALPMLAVKRNRRQGHDQDLCLSCSLKTGSLKHVGLLVPWKLNNNDHSSFAFRDLARSNTEREEVSRSVKEMRKTFISIEANPPLFFTLLPYHVALEFTCSD